MTKKHLVIIGIVFLLGLLLRFYKLYGFATFLGDQGRDAIIIKRILTFEHLPAIGAPTSIGQIYLGPFYYYFIAPWLALFKFDPFGLAFGVAVFSSLYVLINYFIVRELLNEKVALISSALIAFSSTLIEFARFSWNPNLLPLFSLISVYFLIKSLKTHDLRFYALTGAFFSFSLQLHYLAFFLFPPAAIFFIMQLYEQKGLLKKMLLGATVLLFSFLLSSIPLIIFDLRHNFLNTKNFLKLFTVSAPVAANKFANLLDSFLYLNKFTFHSNLNLAASSFILLFLTVSFILVLKRKDNLRTLLLFLMLAMLGISLYGGPKYPHYFACLYPFYYIILGYFLSLFLISTYWSALIALFFAIYIFLNSQGYYFFFAKESIQIGVAKDIAQTIRQNLTHKNYRLTSLPQRYADTTYRYFLEVWGKKPVEKDSLEKTEELFVVCEDKCKPIGDPQWDVAYFAPRKIAGVWKTDNVKIYKLTR